MSNKVLVIGLDGATFDLLRPWMAEGHLPNLKRLMQAGASGSALLPGEPEWQVGEMGLGYREEEYEA